MSSRDTNPFKFGGELARGKYFVDREEERQKLRKDLKNGERIVVYSVRRYGKTTLIVNVLEELRDEGCITAYLDVSTTPDISLFISKYKSLFIQEKSMEWFFGWLKTNIPKIKISVGDITIDASALSNAELTQAFEKIIDLPQELGKREKKRVVVALDEFHEIVDLGMNTKKLLRSRLQFHDNVSYVFSGSEAHILQDMFQKSNEPFYKSAKMFELHKIPKEAYTKFIRAAFISSGIKISDKLIDEVLEHTDSSTYYTQQLCHELWNVCKVRQKGIAETTELSAAITQVVSDQSAVYEKTWDNLAPTYRKLLIGLVSENHPKVWSTEFKGKMRLSVGAIDKAIKELVRQYLIERDEKKIVIPDPFFKTWLTKKLSESPT